MNFPFTEVDFTGEDPSAPIIPSNGANPTGRPSKKSKNAAIDQSQVTNSKARVNFGNLKSVSKIYLKCRFYLGNVSFDLKSHLLSEMS